MTVDDYFPGDSPVGSVTPQLVPTDLPGALSLFATRRVLRGHFLDTLRTYVQSRYDEFLGDYPEEVEPRLRNDPSLYLFRQLLVLEISRQERETHNNRPPCRARNRSVPCPVQCRVPSGNDGLTARVLLPDLAISHSNYPGAAAIWSGYFAAHNRDW